jgi:hypothetical protein
VDIRCAELHLSAAPHPVSIFIYVPLSLKRYNQYDDGRAFGMRRHEPETFIECR